MAGRKGEKFWSDAVKRAVNRRLENEEGKPKKLERLADRLVEAGLAGEIAALKEIGDRLEGRAPQAVAVTGADGGPVEFSRIERIIVDPSTAKD